MVARTYLCGDSAYRPSTSGARRRTRGSANKFEPHVLAGIARVLRAVPADRAWRSALVAALRRIEFADVYPDFLFDPPASPCCGPRSCVQEIETTIAGLTGQDVTAIGAQGDEAPEFGGRLDAGPLSMALQDQAGEYVTLDGFLRSAPVVLALFYTRCMNPLKCSQTISRLAACARAAPELVYVGMSYDPQYDTPRRLKLYGDDRSFPFSATVRMVRCPEGWDDLEDRLSLRAGYGAATVNAHAREVFLLTEGRDRWRLPPDWLREPSKILEFAGARSEAFGPTS